MLDLQGDKQDDCEQRRVLGDPGNDRFAIRLSKQGLTDDSYSNNGLLEEYAKINNLMGIITVASGVTAKAVVLSLSDMVEGTYI